MLSRPGDAPVTAATAPAAETAVRLDGVTKRFGPSVALDKAWLSIGRGEFLTLLGPSGCGKTTALKMVNRLIEPSGGEILIDGVSVRDRRPADLRREIGYVIQQVGLLPHLTVAANIAFGGTDRKTLFITAQTDVYRVVLNVPGPP